MHDSCQVAPRSIAISGEAGSGKSTLGRALAFELRLPLIDLDSVTNPLLDALPASEHWLTGPDAGAIRNGRYAALRTVARDVIATTGGAVLVAPFTAELGGGVAWDDLQNACGPLQVVRIVGDPALFAARRSDRDAARDEFRPDQPAPDVRVPVIELDADLSTVQQLARLFPALGDRMPVAADAIIFSSTYDAVLCDLDGSLIDSTASVARSWRRWADHYGVSADALHANHGRPARTLVSALIEPECQIEALERIERMEVADALSVRAVRGAPAFWASLPEQRRAIVTSGTVPIASARMEATGLSRPAVWVTAEEVTHGKPDPEPYLIAAERLGVDPGRCLVIEDAPAGIASARAAGCHVLAVTGTGSLDELAAASAVVDGLDRVRVEQVAGGLRLLLVS
ncbi:HAD-IA family hydrolase [Rathayibacter soli]|uniref:HAD-IA family hydrolase n=1 Tax=Rathayibacter soli TaxID=3144168 RepID=UPI0027E47CE7|nr:HAD-IA family hydrolase [Glaciibacter superstes]